MSLQDTVSSGAERAIYGATGPRSLAALGMTPSAYRAYARKEQGR